jgi:diadenosine tetraphosphate (Ap4A) HIT family hydrolase
VENTDPVDSHECKTCAVLADTAASDWIWRGDGWAATVSPGTDVPGWIVVSTEDHVEGLWSLTSEQAASFGPVARRLSDAIRSATNAECVYLVALGESQPHFHFLLAARTAGVPETAREFSYLSAKRELIDLERSREVAARIRAELTASPAGAAAMR